MHLATGIFEAVAAEAAYLFVAIPFAAAVYTVFAAFDLVAMYRQWRSRGTA